MEQRKAGRAEIAVQGQEIWAILIRLQIANRVRDLALFNLAVDSKLRACDLVTLRVRDLCHGERVATRSIVMQQKTGRPVQFEITEPTRDAIENWFSLANRRSQTKRKLFKNSKRLRRALEYCP